MQRNGHSYTLLLRMEMDSFFGDSLPLSQRAGRLPRDPPIPLPISTQESCELHTQTSIGVFTEALFVIAKTW